MLDERQQQQFEVNLLTFKHLVTSVRDFDSFPEIFAKLNKHTTLLENSVNVNITGETIIELYFVFFCFAVLKRKINEKARNSIYKIICSKFDLFYEIDH